ncbi:MULTISPECIES: hypothetical protein [unclassified Rhizobium]|jgi:hypothetical protein|uniref:hypothetical protein n=1 Tax=Rhizobium sp. Rhizsp82 TaxID=3243057 RepID=UPI0039B4A1D2
MIRTDSNATELPDQVQAQPSITDPVSSTAEVRRQKRRQEVPVSVTDIANPAPDGSDTNFISDGNEG